MFSKRNPMKYFSGNAFARLPLYKLVAGGSAVVLTASIGLGVMAASFTPQAQPEPTPEYFKLYTVICYFKMFCYCARNRLIYEHSITFKFGDLLICFYFIHISLILIIRQFRFLI